MYLRPGNLNKDFWVAREQTGLNSAGRPQKRFEATGARLRGILAEAKTEERVRWQQMQHPITHTIVQRGRAIARTGDLLTLDSRSFFVQGVDDAGDLGFWTLYYAEERFDLNGANGG